MNNLECLLEKLFKEKEYLLYLWFGVDIVIVVYLIILDGLFVEMLYGGRLECLEKRIFLIWNVFW